MPLWQKTEAGQSADVAYLSFFPPAQIKKGWPFQATLLKLVEAAGVEPASASTLPSALHA